MLPFINANIAKVMDVSVPFLGFLSEPIENIHSTTAELGMVVSQYFNNVANTSLLRTAGASGVKRLGNRFKNFGQDRSGEEAL